MKYAAENSLTRFWQNIKTKVEQISKRNGLSLVLLNSAQSIPCTSAGVASSTMTIQIPFVAYKGNEMTASSVTNLKVGDTLVSGVTVKTITPSTSTTEGLIELSVASRADFGSSNTLYGRFEFDFKVELETDGTIEIMNFKKYFGWIKAKAGASGSSARRYFIESSVDYIIKSTSGNYLPTSITFESYYTNGTDPTKNENFVEWKIFYSLDGTTFTHLMSETFFPSCSLETSEIPIGSKFLKVQIEDYNTASVISSITIPILYSGTSEKILYENSTGTSTDFSLSEEAKEFDRIKVFYKTSDNYLGSIEFMVNKSGISNIYITQQTYGFGSGSYTTFTYFTRMQFYGAKSVFVYSYYSQDGKTTNTSNKLFITKVIGIKES